LPDAPPEPTSTVLRPEDRPGFAGVYHSPTRAALEELDWLADLLDTRWRIPGLNVRFGAEAVAGLVPVLGDLAGAAVSAYLIMRARELGAPRHVVARMIGNVALDTVFGSVPIVGSVFDVFYKANKRNIRLLKKHLEQRDRI
jgi:hypothetical protein